MKLISRTAISTLALTGLLVYGIGAGAQQTAPNTQSPNATDSAQMPAGDNTKTNQQDRNPNQPTADRQKDNPADRELTQHVRQAIMQDKSLSTYAHNVKVISQNGVVTLKGPVRTDEEKRSIEAKANEVAGKDKVVNDLTVVPEQK